MSTCLVKLFWALSTYPHLPHCLHKNGGGWSSKTHPQTCQGNFCYHVSSNVLKRHINLVYLALVYATNKHMPELQQEPSCSGHYSYLCFTTDHYWMEFKRITWPSDLGCRCLANDAPLLLLLHWTQSLKLYISLNVLFNAKLLSSIEHTCNFYKRIWKE